MRRLLLFSLVLLSLIMPRAVPTAAQDASSVKVAEDEANGAILTDANDMTLYLFTPDTTAGESACDEGCAVNWPPLAPADDLTLPEGVPGALGTIDRADGTQQVTYNDIPLYLYVADRAAGDVNGEGVGGVWFVVHPGAALGEYPAAPAEGTPFPASTLEVGFTGELGPFLTTADGMTVYLFTNDTAPGESTCEGDCATAWPPVPANGTLMLPPGIQGTLTAIDRPDGSQQLAYNGIPLYLYAGDQVAGDTNGQDSGDVWYIVPPGMNHGDEPHNGEEDES